ncbi:MAG TPA: ABC transporter substrate-binding protein [Rhodospirillaceae bacterium]|nr:ABC transporter substrate-binding protein [Rhodospirillaceae bacterium]
MSPITLSRRRLLQISAAGAATLTTGAASADNDGKVRLTWGNGLLPGIAKERGEFERRLAGDGIRVEWLGPFISHAPSIQAVAGGSADFSFGGTASVALAAMIAGAPLLFAQFLTTEPRSTAIVARDGIENIQDLAGKSVAANRSGVGEMVLMAALEKYGLDRSAVKIVYLSPADGGAAFAAGRVDAWSIWSPLADIAREKYKAHTIFLETEISIDIDFGGFVVARKFVDEHPETVRLVNAAYAAEAKWTEEHPREAGLILQKKLGYSDAIRETLIAARRRTTVYGVQDANFLERAQRSADWLTAHGVLPSKIAVADHVARI